MAQNTTQHRSSLIGNIAKTAQAFARNYAAFSDDCQKTDMYAAYCLGVINPADLLPYAIGLYDIEKINEMRRRNKHGNETKRTERRAV